ncbi:MAG: hypothetical protein JO051_03365 [Acidobacteriaceae bacterium]|nr:hypothetical protein [Acidobacteriaceae bacterium]
MDPIETAPKGKTIIVTGGWYEHPESGERIDFVPSFVAWDDLEGKWIMQDDHKRPYNEPKFWTET